MLTKIQINSQIKSIKGKNEKLRDQIHAVAVSIIGHAFSSNDVSLATRLVDAMGRGLDRQALVTYFEDMGCMRWDKNTASFKLKKKVDAVFDEEFLNSEDCARWYDYARDKKALTSAYDLETRVASLLKQFTDVKDKGEREVRNEELESYIRDAMIKYHMTLEIA